MQTLAHHGVRPSDSPGKTPLFDGEGTVDRYADTLEAHLHERRLEGSDLVGSSLGARLVLEMARRGLGRSVAFDPGGFWSPMQKKVFGATLGASVSLVRALRPVLPSLLGNPAGRTALLAQLSARLWAAPADFALSEVRGLADAPRSSPAIKALASKQPRPAGCTGRHPARPGAGRLGQAGPRHPGEPGHEGAAAVP